ncbi:MAG: methyltransferase domain-containing protein [Gemmatimonadales bacterium]
MSALAEITPVGEELLDDPAADPALVRRSLENIAVANRLFGGVAAARYGVDRLLRGRRAASVSLLDVGTGLGDVPRALGSHWARRGVALRATGIERNPTAARLATGRGVPTVTGDGLRLPFANRSVDIVLLCQIAHHFGPDGIAQLAAEATRVARVGVVLADLERSHLARWGFAVASRMLRFDPATVADGVTSVKRGFRVAELTAHLARAGVVAECVRRPGWRVVATWSVSP